MRNVGVLRLGGRTGYPSPLTHYALRITHLVSVRVLSRPQRPRVLGVYLGVAAHGACFGVNVRRDCAPRPKAAPHPRGALEPPAVDAHVADVAPDHRPVALGAVKLDHAQTPGDLLGEG